MPQQYLKNVAAEHAVIRYRFAVCIRFIMHFYKKVLIVTFTFTEQRGTLIQHPLIIIIISKVLIMCPRYLNRDTRFKGTPFRRTRRININVNNSPNRRQDYRGQTADYHSYARVKHGVLSVQIKVSVNTLFLL